MKQLMWELSEGTLWATVQDLNPTSSLMNKIDGIYHSKSSTMAAKELKDFLVINGEVCHRVSGGVLDQACPWPRPNKSYNRFMIFLVKRTMLAFISVYISMGIVSLIWLKRPLICKWPVRSARNPVIEGSLYLSEKPGIEGSPIWISCSTVIAFKSFWCDKN